MKKLLLLFTMLLSAIVAIGQNEPYEINVFAQPTEGGTVTGAGYYDPENPCTLTATANENYKFINWTKLGQEEPVSDSSTYTFLVTESATFTANFALTQTSSYNVTIDPQINHAQIDAEPNENVLAGQTIIVSINNIEPYYDLEIGSLKYLSTAGDFPIELIDNLYQFDMPASDVTITANFTKRKHQVLPDPGIVNGTLSILPQGEVEVGETVQIIASPNTGYKLDSIFYYDPEGNPHRIANDSLLMPDYDLSIRASFSIKDHRISVEVHPEGTGTATVEPTVAEQDETVTITIAPEQNYMLESIEAYYYSWFMQHNIPITQINDSTYSFIMVDHEVTVEVNFKRVETPIIGEIGTPNPICAGYPLELVAPSVENGEQEGWQISDDDFNETIEAYTGQPLGLAYNGWKLRYWASNSLDTCYSNTVVITIQGLDGLAIEGNAYVTMDEQGNYKVTGTSTQCSFEWTVSDTLAIIEDSLVSECRITWKGAGTQQVTVVVTENATGCSDTLSMAVEVGACIDEADINTIKAKKHEGKEYILIYPNPKDNYYYQWYRDDMVMEGETGQYLYREGGLGSGKYKVRISLFENGNCWAETEEYLIGGRSMVYPNLMNRGNNMIVVKDCEGEAQLELYAIDGRLMFNQKLTDHETTISLDVPPGIYVAYITDQSGSSKAEKIVVQ